MKKKMLSKVIMSTFMLTMALSMSGCSGDKESKKPEESSKKVEENENATDKKPLEEKTTEEVTTAEQETAERVTFEGDLYSISNEKITWGVGVHTFEDNRPVSPVNLQKSYGEKYAVEFIKEDEKNIYLTFDEGYENGYTGQILDVLKEKNVKAVFFITMPYAKTEPELIKRMVDEGHVIGAHSVTHPSEGMPSISVEQQINEYKELEKYVEENYGYKMYLFRPPTGAFSEQSLAVAQSCGYRSIMWSFAYYDYNVEDQMPVSEALDNAVNKLHNGAIYLLHAVSKTNTDMLGDFIDKTQAAGYTFKEYK